MQTKQRSSLRDSIQAALADAVKYVLCLPSESSPIGRCVSMRTVVVHPSQSGSALDRLRITHGAFPTRRNREVAQDILGLVEQGLHNGVRGRMACGNRKLKLPSLCFLCIMLLWSFTTAHAQDTNQVQSFGLIFNPQPQTQMCGQIGNLAGWWKFDEGTGTFTADSSGNGNDGTLTNKPVWVTGMFSNALEFTTGSNQWVWVETSGVVTGSFTVSAWLLPKDSTVS